jgi:hypothetical protein
LTINEYNAGKLGKTGLNPPSSNYPWGFMSQTIHSVAQPIVCCLGTSVAGQPTQFLFERAMADAGADWRAISVEVAPQALQVACDGMLAMHFQGIRLFGELQTLAVSCLASDDAIARFVGRATSGMAAVNHWSLWDHWGHAWKQLLRHKAGTNPVIYWLHGDSPTTRSTFVALMAEAGDSPNWLWTQSPNLELESPWQSQLGTWIAEGRLHNSNATLDLREPLASWLSSCARPSPLAQVALVSEVLEFPSELLAPIDELPIEWIVPASIKLPTSLINVPVQRIQSAELAVAGEAYDFHRWTNCTIEYSLLQDAYDEYCDF